MGATWEVNSWLGHGESYAYVQVYYGNSFFGMIRAVLKAKRESGCVKVEWR